eukprot:UN08755
MIYGQFGLKSDYSGHNTEHYDNIYGYVTDTCVNSYAYNTDPQIAGFVDAYYNNTCILDQSVPQNYGTIACQSDLDSWPVLGNNTIYINSDNVTVTGLCGMSEIEFQKKYNTDLGTVINGPANTTLILSEAKAMLWS